MAAEGLDPDWYVTRHRTQDEILPWDHIAAGLHKDFLWQDWQAALAEHGLPDCRWTPCYDCGVCTDYAIEHIVASPVPPAGGSQGTGQDLSQGHTVPVAAGDEVKGDNGFPVRVRFSKHGKVRFVGHRDVARGFERAFRIAELPLSFTLGFSPRPKVSFGLALSVGHESDAEYLDVELSEPIDLDGLPERLTAALPEGIVVTGVAALADRAPALQEAVTAVEWQLEVTAPDGRGAGTARGGAPRGRRDGSTVLARDPNAQGPRGGRGHPTGVPADRRARSFRARRAPRGRGVDATGERPGRRDSRCARRGARGASGPADRAMDRARWRAAGAACCRPAPRRRGARVMREGIDVRRDDGGGRTGPRDPRRTLRPRRRPAPRRRLRPDGSEAQP